MRLLERKPGGELGLTKYLTTNIPSYAILSHTWGNDGEEEVTFQEMDAGTGQTKPGYQKLEFCIEQADRDGLRYCWVDTCCIDKSSSTELSEAIISMFRWYKNSTRCYAYLSDVSTAAQPQHVWEPAFQRSRWFTRGWTLQELLAPSSVGFFAKDRTLLGDKHSLLQELHDITGIATRALRDQDSLCTFSIDERFEWAKSRQTTKEEDWVYSLLGVFDVSMAILYGEGKEKALRRLRKEIPETPALQGEPSPTPVESFSRSLLPASRRRGSMMRRSGRSVNQGGRVPECYRCGFSSHLLPDCIASEETVRRTREKRGVEGVCFNCGLSEHWIEDCKYSYLL